MKKKTSTGLVGPISQLMVVLCGGVVADEIKMTQAASMLSIRSQKNRNKKVSWVEGPI